jgi:tetratricopeptide (TPR) repeat protein
MPDQLAQISTRGPLRRTATLVPLALALVWALFSARWYVGDTIAEYMNPEDRGLQTARLAVALTPADPFAHWRLGDIEQNLLTQDQAGQAMREFDQATRLSPNDYRFWLPLGRALEQHGDIQKAELAMRRAVELAPAYSYPRWYLGNLLLRSGRNTEGFAELRRAAEADPQLRPQVFNLALEVYEQNFDEMKSAIGPSLESRAEFAKYLFERGRVADGMRIWNTLSAKEKAQSRATGESLMKSLVDGKRHRQALEIWNDLAPSGVVRSKTNEILDGGFEQSLAGNSGPFGWQWKSTQQGQVGVDSASSHSGGRSLRILFQTRSKVDINISQLLVIDPSTQYDLEFFTKTKGLESAGTPIVEIVDATDGQVLASSQPAPAGNTDWQPTVVTFKTGAKAEAIVLRFNRASCGGNAVCPIFGTVWYDDFNLKRRN